MMVGEKVYKQAIFFFLIATSFIAYSATDDISYDENMHELNLDNGDDTHYAVDLSNYGIARGGGILNFIKNFARQAF